MIRVYTASKLSYADSWRSLEAKWPFVFFHARWLRHVNIGTPGDERHAVRFWCEDEEDVRNADALLLFANQGDHLRGALVEAGIAISCQVPVIVVGNHPDYGTWQHHPGVKRVASMEEAGALLQALDEAQWRILNERRDPSQSVVCPVHAAERTDDDVHRSPSRSR